MQLTQTLNSRPDKCPHCGRLGLWCHGFYTRQSDRINPSESTLNAIFIQRYYCPGCNKTCSALPECIPPYRWHLWETQEAALKALLMGATLYKVAKEALPSRNTIRRWWNRLQVQFLAHKDTLCTVIPALGRFAGSIQEFWLATFNQMRLGTAMRLCQVAGVVIP